MSKRKRLQAKTLQRQQEEAAAELARRKAIQRKATPRPFVPSKAEKRQLRKPYLPLPTTVARLKSSGQVCHLGCALPLHLGGSPVLSPESDGSKRLVAVKANCTALLRLTDKLIRRGGVNKLIYATVSQLFGQPASLAGLSYAKLQRMVDAAKWPLGSAVQMCRLHGYRLVLFNDCGHHPQLLSFLTMLHSACNVREYGLFKIWLSYDKLTAYYQDFGIDYRNVCNERVFAVINDVAMDQASASGYLTWCLQQRLPFAVQLNRISKPTVWLKSEKYRLRHCLRPLIIIDAQFKLTKNNVDTVLAKYVGLAKYSDVLIRR